jgi:hypothetical protein
MELNHRKALRHGLIIFVILEIIIVIIAVQTSVLRALPFEASVGPLTLLAVMLQIVRHERSENRRN